MMTIDCRGLACPAPVLQAKQAIEKERPSALEVAVDNEAARENVSRFLKHQGYEVSVTEEGGVFRVIGTSRGTPPASSSEPQALPAERSRIMILVGSDRMGRGDDELGAGLMVNFLKTLKEMGDDLWRLVFINSGVKLTIEGAEPLPVLQEYEREGLQILVCGTCLAHFHLLERKQVGETTNMLDIVTALQLADKVINL
ncbi:MAG: sulfurtransferase-like selenium metabolism protein YedF [Deltaproteobacteria bacterium]|nr:sulfurtransferase-like selenium metabolism protein YedF [Deltaproteobacteria bacterium]